MWRNGTGHKAQRSTGPRAHAGDLARQADQHKKASAITVTKVQSHRTDKIQEKIEQRAAVRQQFIEQRRGEADGRDRLHLLMDRRREERREQRQPRQTDDAEEEEEDEEEDFDEELEEDEAQMREVERQIEAAQAARVKQAIKLKQLDKTIKKQEAKTAVKQQKESQLMLGVKIAAGGILLMLLASLFF